MLLPDPGFPDYLSGIALANVRYETFPLVEENQYLPNYYESTESQKEEGKLMYP
ncbi:hypothetical protein [Niallia sp. Krafla_26]|uniref:hypothetical protein n=1 Tax=Niallia sp. Krafla_26 TaxID=3064703 RepID=UPI003D164D48